MMDRFDRDLYRKQLGRPERTAVRGQRFRWDQFGHTNDGTGNTYDSFEIDTVAPTVTVSLSNSAIKAGDTVTVTLNASEPLIGLGTASDELQVPNLTSAGSATSNGEGTVWTKTYTADADVDDPTNVITLLAGEAIDVAANSNVAASQSANYVVDTIDPLLEHDRRRVGHQHRR